MKILSLFRITLITTPILIGVMAWHAKPLKTSVTPNGIIDAEFAVNTARAKEISEAWSPMLLHHAFINIYIDFLFLLSYGLFLFSAIYLLSRKLHGTLEFIRKTMAYSMLFAAGLDAIENVCMIITFSGTYSGFIIGATALIAAIKFLLVIIGILFLVLGILQYFYLRTRLHTPGTK